MKLNHDNRLFPQGCRALLLASVAGLATASAAHAQIGGSDPRDFEPTFVVREGSMGLDITWVPARDPAGQGQCYIRRVVTNPILATSNALSYRRTDAYFCGRDANGEFQPGLSRYDSPGVRGTRGTVSGATKPPGSAWSGGLPALPPSNEPGGLKDPGAAYAETPDVQDEIIGRDDVPPEALLDSENRFSNVVFIVTEGPSGTSTCTGTLINRRQVLTAAHCFPSEDSQIVQVSFDPEGQTAIFDAMSVTLHDEFAFENGRSDVAIITLDTSALIASPVQLDDAAGTHAVVGRELIIAGYGLTGDGLTGGTFQDGRRRFGTNTLEHVGTLAEAGFPADLDFGGITLDSDRPYLIADFDSPDWPSAANITANEVSTAPGDSGGPAFVMTDNGLVQVGITSFSLNFSAPMGTYDTIILFQPVSEHAGWINGLNPFVQSQAVAGDGDWFDEAHWQSGDIPFSDFRFQDETVITTEYAVPQFYQVVLDQAGTTSLNDAVLVDTLAVYDDAALQIGSSGYLWLDTGLALDGGEVQLDGVLVSQMMELSSGRFVVGETGEYVDFSPYYSAGITQAGAEFIIDGAVTTDWFYQAGGVTRISGTGSFFDWDGSWIAGGGLLVEGEFDTGAFIQTGGHTIIGETGWLFDAFGSTYIENTLLEVDGVLDTLDLFAVNSTLSGGGYVSAPFGVGLSGGTLSPGSLFNPGQGDVLTIDGDLFGENIFLAVATGAGGSDRLAVSGRAVLSGSLNYGFVPGYQPVRNSRFNFIEADGGLDISGLSLQVTELSPVLSLSLGANQRSGFVTVEARDYAEFAQSDQQRAVATALDAALGDEVPTGALAELAQQLDHLRDAETLRTALGQSNPTDSFSVDRFDRVVSRGLAEQVALRSQLFRSGQHGGGAVATGVQLASADTGAALFSAVRAATLADDVETASLNDRTGLYLSTRVTQGEFALSNGDYSFDASLALAGVDHEINDHWMLGANIGFADYGAGRQGAQTQGRNLALNGYAIYAAGPVYGQAYVGISRADFTLTRAIQLGPELRRATAQTESDAWFAGFEAGVAWVAGDWTHGPALSLHHNESDLAAYQESGAGAFNTAVADRNADQSLAGISWRMSTRQEQGARRWNLHGELGWYADISAGDRLGGASLQAAPAQAFAVLDKSPTRSFGSVSVGADLQASDRTAISLRLRTDVDRGSDAEHSASLALSWRF